MAEVAGNDNMYRAYLSLPHVTMLLWATLRQFRIWKAVMFFLGTMFLLSCGTRGPLVCLAFFGFGPAAKILHGKIPAEGITLHGKGTAQPGFRLRRFYAA